MLSDVIVVRTQANTREALETAAGAAGVSVPDFCRRALARALTDAARLVRPVRTTRRYPQRGGIVLADLEEDANG